jgi:hypothetical protein
MKVARTMLIVAALAIPTLVATAAAPDKGLGINLHSVSYWSPAIPFADVFRQSGPWVPQRENSQAWNTGEALVLDRHGWVRSLTPGQHATRVILGGIPFPSGRYQVAFEGRGKLSFGLDARVVEQRGNRLVVDVQRKHAMVLVKLLETDAGDPVRNIRVMLPGHEPDSGVLFNQPYLDYLKGFRVIRFMDWGNTNLNDTVQWAQRTRPESVSQDQKSGVALEFMIELASRLGAAPWFTVPHAAEDAYVESMARLIHERWPHGKLYVEYSNEVWNRIFPQHAHAVREAKRLALPDPDAFYAHRALEVFRIFERVFGGSERVVRVLSGQAVNVSRAQRLLGHTGVRGNIDAYAIAPYFGHSGELGAVEGVGHDELMARLERSVDGVAAIVRANRDVASAAGVALVAYEGGQHVTNPPGKPEFCARLNRDQRMEALYERYLDLWSRETDGALMAVFADVSGYRQSGCWGIAEYPGQPLTEAPKLRAVRRHLSVSGGAR